MKNISLCICIFFSSGYAAGAMVDYCDEIDTNPDLTKKNARIFENPHTLGCNLTTTLPGLGALNIGEAICDKLSDKANRALDKARNKLDQELAGISEKAKSEYEKLKNSDVFKDQGGSYSPDLGSGGSSGGGGITAESVFRDGTYSNGKFYYTTPSGMNFSTTMTRDAYVSKKGATGLAKSIKNAEKYWLAKKAREAQQASNSQSNSSSGASQNSNEVTRDSLNSSGSSGSTSGYNGYFN